MQKEVAAVENHQPPQQPWVRINTAAKLLEIKRSRMYTLLKNAPEIKTATLRAPSAKRGAVLVNIPSLMEYLEALATSQQQEKKGDLGNE